MKSNILIIIFAIGVLQLCGQQAVIDINDTQNPNQTQIVIARDEVRMTNGFFTAPNTPNYFHAYTNENMVLPANYVETPININNRELDTLLPVGSLAGTHNVSLTGAATYNVPIIVPPGTAGMEPSVSVNYNSQGGNGLLGYGWNISGISMITRTPPTRFYDGFLDAVKFNKHDAFTWNGKRLIKIGGIGDGDTLYTTQAEGYTRIVASGSSGNGPLYWTITLKNGTKMTYGSSEDSRHQE